MFTCIAAKWMSDSWDPGQMYHSRAAKCISASQCSWLTNEWLMGCRGTVSQSGGKKHKWITVFMVNGCMGPWDPAPWNTGTLHRLLLVCHTQWKGHSQRAPHSSAHSLLAEPSTWPHRAVTHLACWLEFMCVWIHVCMHSSFFWLIFDSVGSLSLLKKNFRGRNSKIF